GEIVRRLSRVETVRILAPNRETMRSAIRQLERVNAKLESVEFYLCATDRSWTRDYCPLFVKNEAGETAITDWKFNGWAKYSNWQRDNAVPAWLARNLGMRSWQTDLVLEGGSIDVNGRGALLTTEECMLSPVQARNPHLTREDLERALESYLGARSVIWLKNGIAGDDTHGHVDDLARFTAPDTIAIASEEDSRDANYETLRENLAILRKHSFRVVKLPMPEPIVFAGRRLPASYANFYIANGLVLVPTFNDPNDRAALNILAKLFPGRQVTGINCTDLIWGLGALHCMTQQQPAPARG